MGNAPSDLTFDEIEELREVSVFTIPEIKRLYRRFQRLDKDGTGMLTMDEFLSIPELSMNPLVMRVINLFDEDCSETVSFKQFIRTLSVFSPQAKKEDKLMFAFKVYDEDNDGNISNGDLFNVLKMMVGDNLTDDLLQKIVDKTIAEASDGDDKITFDQFVTVLGHSDVESKMSIKF